MEDIKRNRYILEALRSSSSKSLAEVYPDVEKICVDAKITFVSGVGISREKKYHLVVERNQSCHVHFD